MKFCCTVTDIEEMPKKLLGRDSNDAIKIKSTIFLKNTSEVTLDHYSGICGTFQKLDVFSRYKNLDLINFGHPATSFHRHRGYIVHQKLV